MKKNNEKSVILNRPQENLSQGSSPKNYRLFMEKAEVNSAPICLNCVYCYIPLDTAMSPSNEIEFYCNQGKDRPLSGDILSEPFEYYDNDMYLNQSDVWAKWGLQNKVALNGTCDRFKRAKL